MGLGAGWGEMEVKYKRTGNSCFSETPRALEKKRSLICVMI